MLFWYSTNNQIFILWLFGLQKPKMYVWKLVWSKDLNRRCLIKQVRMQRKMQKCQIQKKEKSIGQNQWRHLWLNPIRKLTWDTSFLEDGEKRSPFEVEERASASRARGRKPLRNLKMEQEVLNSGKTTATSELHFLPTLSLCLSTIKILFFYWNLSTLFLISLQCKSKLFQGR